MGGSIAPWASSFALRHKTEVNNMTTSIERLRDSRVISLRDQFSAGKRAGRSWAMKVATYEQLVRMSRYHSSVERGRATGNASDQALDLRDQLIAETAKKGCLADDTDHVAVFFTGFMDGVTEFFDEVEVEVQSGIARA
jgi:hypothetical protein